MMNIRRTVKSACSSIGARLYFACLRHPKRIGWDPNFQTEGMLFDALSMAGVNVRSMRLDAEEYQQYFAMAEYSMRYPNYYRENIAEKSLEHFIAQKLLCLQPNDVYVDIASEASPVPEIYSRLFGCVTYAQDVSYEAGIHGNKIGGSAAALPLDDASVTKMALHCSFEHFESDSDCGFISEAGRVLKVDGAVVIVPLYLSSRYAVVTDPLVSKAAVRFEPDALVMAVKGWGNRHGRFYDPVHLCSRVLTQSDNLEFTIFAIENRQVVSSSCYVRFALMAKRVR